MAESPNTDQVSGIVKVVVGIFGGLGLGKAIVALGNNIWDRLKAQDTQKHERSLHFEDRVWQELEDEKELTDNLRIELQQCRDKMYDCNLAAMKVSLDRDRLAIRNLELEAENEKLRALRLHFRQDTEPKE